MCVRLSGGHDSARRARELNGPPARGRLSETLRAYHSATGSQPGVLAALRGEGWHWAGASGVADAVTGRELRPTAAVRVASVTKTFTAAAVLRLVERGELRLDEPVCALASEEVLGLLAEGAYEPTRMTVRHLLQHTAGLYDWGSDPDYDAEAFADPAHRWSRLEQVRWAVEHGRPLAPPGEEFHYSDTGYVILGEILERVTGRSLAAAYRGLLPLGELGLASIHLESLEPTPAAGAERAHQYVSGADLLAVDPSCDLWGGGGLVSTMPDLAGFVRALFRGEVFERPATLATMLAPVEARGAQGRGMGIRTLALGPGRWWGHCGCWGVVMAYEPDRDLAVATTVTRMPGNPDDRLSVGRELIRTVR
ncbi:serine hydrolase domain-containing protein [Streptomyces sp. MJP52]|uniref:serine hydrolase domain-containing protein n=1 Tax=Streptomyces sp. MJP52 TaxID=2940555 RepID=UPI0024743CEB|nr:serine hydrolase domain-containing protein [Streptomyces sp. MJP52]MDH6223824.1 D-alanyl-D-alanine carboxypeptidase [Streptomyces sp. MJP52]